MNKLRLEHLYSRINELSQFMDKKRTQAEIISWVAECVSLFTEIGVNDSIISNFINFFHPRKEDSSGLPMGLGVDHYMGTFKLSSGGLYVSEAGSYLAEIGFISARSVLERLSDEERLVPSWLFMYFKENTKYSHISSSLELIEDAYQARNCDSIIKNSRTLLSSILNLEPKLGGRDLGPQLNSIIDGKGGVLLSRFGVSKDMIIGLNFSRLIRNTKVDHKDLPMQYNIPFAVAVSNASLVITFLEITMAAGNIIVDEGFTLPPL